MQFRRVSTQSIVKYRLDRRVRELILVEADKPTGKVFVGGAAKIKYVFLSAKRLAHVLRDSGDLSRATEELDSWSLGRMKDDTRLVGWGRRRIMSAIVVRSVFSRGRRG